MARALSYANVVATVALFAALGGSSYAAIRVTGRDVQDGSLTGADVRNSSLTGADVRNGSLGKRDFKAGQLPQGDVGPQGPPGAPGLTGKQGPPGPAGLAGTARAYGLIKADGTTAAGSVGIVSSRSVDFGPFRTYCLQFAFTPVAIVATPTADNVKIMATSAGTTSCKSGEQTVAAFDNSGFKTATSFSVMAN